jgi:Mrp family chromosome partitioning ATPase/uncharacterized protein involved in exopolysaccharide biosynthesis
VLPAASSGDLRPLTSGLGRYLTFLKKKWWIPLLSVLFFGGLAAAYIVYWPASYASTAHLWAAGKIGLQLHEGATYNEDSLNFAGTQVELLQSDKISERAFARVLKVPGVIVPTNSEGKPKLVSIKVSQLPKSAVLELKAKGPNETYTRAFLDAAMDDFLAYKKEVRSATSGDTYTSVSEQITRQQADLKAAQDKLTNYQRDNNVAVLEEQAKAASAYLTQLLAEFSQLKVEYQLLEAMTPEGQWALAAVTNALLGAADPGKLAASSLPSAAPPPELLRAQQELEKIRIIRARLSKYLRPGHPKIIKLDEEISRGEKLVEFFSQQSRDQLVNAKQTVKLKLDRVQETIKEWEAKVNNASVRIAEYQRMKLDVERLQGLNDRLLGLLQTVDVTRNLDQENITVLDRASKAKDAKHTILVAAFLLFVGLGAGLGLVFLVEQADDRLMSLEELGGRFQEWVVGQIPEVRRAKKKKRPALLDADDCRHTFAESHRNIRSALFFANYNEPKPKTLLVTSAIPNEGKSTVAANLARTIAFAGGRVLLVDGDMRRGVLHQLFETPQEPGLSDLLINGGDLSQFVIPIPLGPEVSGQSSVVSHQSSAATAPSSVLSPQSSVVSGQPQVSAFSPQPSPKPSTLNSQRPPTSDPVPPTSDLRPLTTGHLFLLPRGQTAQNSGELFLSEKCDRLLAQMREQYDCVILDSIPVFAADDTTSLAPKVDGVLFVMRNKFTSADTARHALELLYERQAKIMGLVFNRANSASRSYKYYKYAKYYHEETKDL